MIFPEKNSSFLCAGNFRKIFLTILLTLIFASTSTAELITSQKFSYSIDFPEGFEISDMEEDETTVLFKHTILSVEALIKVWPQEIFEDSLKAMEGTMKKLDATFDTSEVVWRNRKCTVASFSSSKLSQEKCDGWGVSIPLTEKKSCLVVLSYAKSNIARDCEQFMISLLDSILIDAGSLKENGIITAAFFPRNKPEEINLTIEGNNITTQIDAIDSEANQFVLEREFDVFKLYAVQNSKLAIPAWQRFYRIVAKDSLSRLKKASFDIKSELTQYAKEKDPKNPDAAIAQTLLFWTQKMQYERASSNAAKVDFTNVIDILKGKGCDCDSRSMLLAVLTKNMGMDSCFVISSEYSHALFAVCFPDKQGQTIKIDGKNYLLGETTHKDVTLGMIPTNRQDSSKWISVEFMY